MPSQASLVFIDIEARLARKKSHTIAGDQNMYDNRKSNRRRAKI
jgi:hypothetical protein